MDQNPNLQQTRRNVQPPNAGEGPAAPNPLSKYFRQPVIFITLPSGGEYWPEGALEIPVTGELPIYPLTTRDEVILKTPDALMNGSGVVDVIHSCCPSIKNAWKMPSIDVDTVLIAIRIASYGNNMDFDTVCPHCQEENTYSQDLRENLSRVKKPNYDNLVNVEQHGLQIKLRPPSYFDSNKVNKIGIEEQKMLQTLENTDLDPEVRGAQIQATMKSLIMLSLESLASSTDYIQTDDGQRVTDAGHILEFYKNSGSHLVKVLQDKLTEFNQEGSIPPLDATCGHCNEPYKVPIEFNYSSFFGKGS